MTNTLSMKDEVNKYEEWLTCITNSRLLFNTIGELETFLEAPSIHSNGIKRCFGSAQRIRSAFRDLAGEVQDWTNGSISLEHFMQDYKKAWDFYKINLARRSDPNAIALELLRFHFPPYETTGLGPKKISLFKQIEEQDIDITFIVLFLLKAIPGYDSKNGDVTDINVFFSNVLALLDKFTEGCNIYATFPTIITAREEPDKSRFMLYYHVTLIIDSYLSFAEQINIYEATNTVKGNQVSLELEGFWNESGGKLVNTAFWQLESALNKGAYFATLWKKDAENNLTGIRYTLFLMEGDDDSLIAYIQHPGSIRRRMNGQPYRDADHVWYTTIKPTEYEPDSLSFIRMMSSSVWPKDLKMTKVTEQKTLGIYQQWLDKCHIVKPYESTEYEFHPCLYAITQDHLYIESENEGEYFKVPKESFEGFEQIQINDNVGIMLMDGKQYLAFDEFLLYLPTTKAELKKYGITRVREIE